MVELSFHELSRLTLSKLTCIRNRLPLKNLLYSWHFLSPELRSYLISLADNSALCVSLNGCVYNVGVSENKGFPLWNKGKFSLTSHGFECTKSTILKHN